MFIKHFLSTYWGYYHSWWAQITEQNQNKPCVTRTYRPRIKDHFKICISAIPPRKKEIGQTKTVSNKWQLLRSQEMERCVLSFNSLKNIVSANQGTEVSQRRPFNSSALSYKYISHRIVRFLRFKVHQRWLPNFMNSIWIEGFIHKTIF